MCDTDSIEVAQMFDQTEPDTVGSISFGRWLLTQRDRGDWIDGIADAARADRSFPKEGDPEAVRAHLRKQQADGDAFQAIDDAEGAWQNSSASPPLVVEIGGGQ